MRSHLLNDFDAKARINAETFFALLLQPEDNFFRRSNDLIAIESGLFTTAPDPDFTQAFHRRVLCG